MSFINRAERIRRASIPGFRSRDASPGTGAVASVLTGLLCLYALVMAARAAPAPEHVTIAFRHVVIDRQYPNRPHCKATGDLDGDGIADVVVGSARGDGLWWYRSPDWSRWRIDTGDFTTDVQLGDVDGDGDLDVIIPKIKVGIVWYENPGPHGDPATEPWMMHRIDGEVLSHHDVEIGDIDGDGRLDIVTRQGATHVYLQRTPLEWLRTTLPTGGRGGLALADLDRDGDLDIVQNGYWLECPGNPDTNVWIRHEIAAGWPDDVGVCVADMNRDGRPDVLLAPAESAGRLCWYEAPVDARTGPWREHVIDPEISHIHTFKVADMDQDGEPDVVIAEMEQSPRSRVGIYWNLGESTSWRLQVLSTNGSHNLRVADIDGNGLLDVVGANHGNTGARTPIEAWLNGVDGRIGLDRWTYIHADNNREPTSRGGHGSFGISFGDLNGDGWLDIASGRYFYRNPGGDMTRTPWPRVTLPSDPETGRALDAGLLFTTQRHESRPALGPMRDILAEALPNVVWLHAEDRAGERWTARVVAQMPTTRHGDGRTMRLARLAPMATGAEILLSGGGGTHLLRVPAHPLAERWDISKITHTDSDEQKSIAVGDIDGDGHADLVLSAGAKRSEVQWWRNPGNGSTAWSHHRIGSTIHDAKMIAVADIDGDGRLDVIATDSESADSGLFWFRAPDIPISGEWMRHDVVHGYNGLDSLSVADMNQDGMPDLIIGETKGRLRLVIYENVRNGESWKEHHIDEGRESHQGAQVVDLDLDGDLDIVSIAYFNYGDLHIWRNDNGGTRGVSR